MITGPGPYGDLNHIISVDSNTAGYKQARKFPEWIDNFLTQLITESMKVALQFLIPL